MEQMEAVLGRLSEIESAAVELEKKAAEQKKQIAAEYEAKTQAFDKEIDAQTQEKLKTLNEKLRLEAENELLERIDYSDKEDLAEAMFFYEYAASKGDEFLEEHNYSLEEIKDGLQQLAEDAGYGNIMNMLNIG